jgi:hypothetical protein
MFEDRMELETVRLKVKMKSKKKILRPVSALNCLMHDEGKRSRILSDAM